MATLFLPAVPQKLLTANAKRIRGKKNKNPTKPKPKLNALASLAAWLSRLDQTSVAVAVAAASGSTILLDTHI